MHPEDFGWEGFPEANTDAPCIKDNKGKFHYADSEDRFLTEQLGVIYADAEDNYRKERFRYIRGAKLPVSINTKYTKTKAGKFLMRCAWGRKLMMFLFGKKRKPSKGWPVGKFPGVNKTDQERVENMVWVLNDKTPYIRTQKCDGSSGTYILERKRFGKFEFYVCSRNVRMKDENQPCFYEEKNYYWEVAFKYNIEKKMREYLNAHKKLKFVCWQGEICAPGIQQNPHGLTETHFYCFHWTDDGGRKDIRDARDLWKEFGMEVVPIDDELYMMPGEEKFEEFKKSADGEYDESVCEGKVDRAREGFVYYKVDDPTFSFKNVSRLYLLKRGD